MLIGPLIQEWSSQPASRYLLTVAAVDDRTLELDRYESLIGIDQARYRDHLYSDKAPYQPLGAAPPYALFRLAGGDAFPAGWEERGVDALLDGRHLGLWWVTVWSSLVPAIALAWLTRRMVAVEHPDVATPVAAAMAFGTTLLPFSSLLFAHVLAALLVAAAWQLLRRDGSGLREAGLAGLCLGLGIGVEYSVAALAVLFLLTQARHLRSAAALSVGTVVGTLPLMLYNWLVFEDPFEVSYQGHLPNFQGEGALGVYNLEVPQLDEIARALFGGRGLFVLTPIMLLAFAGCALALQSGTARMRRDAVVALAGFALMLALSTGIDGIGGDSPGPRYLIPALPLLALPLAEAWRRYPVLGIGTTAIGVVAMTAATITDPIAPALRDWLLHLRDGELATNVFTGRGATWPVVVSTIAGLAIVVHLLRPDRQGSSIPQRSSGSSS